MAERVDIWWARRQFSKGSPVPYAVGTYRAAWKPYPVLIRQYHPELNHGITLTQIPPAAEVYLVWECEVGHRFVATPAEQRARPGGPVRRRSAWCTECARLAESRPLPKPAGPAPWDRPDAACYDCGHPRDERRVEPPIVPGVGTRCALCDRLDGSRFSRARLLDLVLPGQRERLAHENSPGARYRWACPRGHGSFEATVSRLLEGASCRVCRHASAGADAVAVGDAFWSRHAPRPASAAEALVRQRLAERFSFDLTVNAVRVAKPFFEHVEVWPDLVLGEVRVALEYDTVGRHGLEHVGRREETDRRKDRLLRSAGWEVVRLRAAPLQALGPFDILGGTIGERMVDRIEQRLGEIRGELFVNAYRR